jgi:predicted HNH restriction endonuclease
MNIEILKKEADKCILVCANCHGEIHEGLINLNNFV